MYGKVHEPQVDYTSTARTSFPCVVLSTTEVTARKLCMYLKVFYLIYIKYLLAGVSVYSLHEMWLSHQLILHKTLAAKWVFLSKGNFDRIISVLGLKMPELGDYDTPLHLISRLRISGAIQALPHMPWWRARSHLFFYLTAVRHFHVSGTV